MGVKGACPLGLPPPLGERGGHPRNFHRQLKTLKGITIEPFFSFSFNSKHFFYFRSLKGVFKKTILFPPNTGTGNY